MKTKKPLATIAYDEDILCKGLHTLSNLGYIDFFAYIRHTGEGSGLSEGKTHFHVFIEPCIGVDPLALKDYFRNKDGSPTCLNFRKSDFQNWYYYTLHDVAYLESKGLKRQYHYKASDMVPSSEAELDRLVSEIEVPECCKVRDALLSGDSLAKMYFDGILRPGNANGIRIIRDELLDSGLKYIKSHRAKKGKTYGNKKSETDCE